MKIDDILAEAPALDPATRQARMQRAAAINQQLQQPAAPNQPEQQPGQDPQQTQQAQARQDAQTGGQRVGNAIRNVGGKIAQGISAVTQAWQQGSGASQPQQGEAPTTQQQPVQQTAQNQQQPQQPQEPQPTQQPTAQQPIQPAQTAQVSMSNVFSNPTALTSAWEAYENAGGKYTPALKQVMRSIWMNMGGTKLESKQ